MRKLGRFGPMLGRAEIGGIQIDVKSRDDIPAILLGLQGLYLNEALREAIFELLLDRFGEDCDLKVGRPGMELWTVLVLAVLKQGLGCDFDRLREHANTHVVLRQLLGHSELEPVTYSYDQVIRNVSLLDEDTLRDINELVVRHGHSLCDHDVGERLAGRCDSFVVETDVHYPTDRNLLWDAARVMVRIAAALADEWNLSGWRQARHLTGRSPPAACTVRTAARSTTGTAAWSITTRCWRRWWCIPSTGRSFPWRLSQSRTRMA